MASMPIKSNAVKKELRMPIHEQITLVLLPLGNTRRFPATVDALLKNAKHHSVDLIVAEGNAPYTVQNALEKRKKKHRHLKILYTERTPSLSEAFNLCLPHIRTDYAFFTHSNIQVRPGWLSYLMNLARTTDGIISARTTSQASKLTPLSQDLSFLSERSSSAFLERTEEVSLHGFFLSRSLLDRLGEFDENISPALLGIDLTLKCKKLGIPLWITQDPLVHSKLPNSNASSSLDKNLAQHLDTPENIRKSLDYLKNKWNSRLVDELAYWSQVNSSLIAKKERSLLLKSVLGYHLFSLILTKINLNNFFKL